MSRIDIPSANQCLFRTSIAPVDSHAIGYGLKDIQRYGHAAYGCNPDVKSCCAIIGDIHSTNIHGASQCMDFFKRPIPALKCKTIMCRAIRQSCQCLCFCQCVGCNQRPVVVVEIDILHHHIGSGTTSTTSLDTFHRRLESIGPCQQISGSSLCADSVSYRFHTSIQHSRINNFIQSHQ